MSPTLYKPVVRQGYTVALSSGGGQAGRGFNKTATVQVTEPSGPGRCLLRKQFRYTVDDPVSLDKAIAKAKKWIDENPRK